MEWDEIQNRTMEYCFLSGGCNHVASVVLVICMKIYFLNDLSCKSIIF